ncbi:hypothetical protein [Legionella sp. 16cNR16C]|uniref:hypothetical protein n=1 Tax=Legionella sp. 16cNR16C TaxID=2905656 RepID=UPI001E365443|nr:hypothetical protein [Legionella sp. 16cNR16C]MCE3043375.1 hypothetical protein [Legionella sp. 16cNR16C]
MNIAVIYWLPNNNDPLIWMMLVDNNYTTIIEPKYLRALNIEETVNAVFEEFENYSSKQEYILKYKSVFEQFKRHKKDSFKFHNEINKQIAKRHVKADRKQATLKKEARKIFKKALSKFEISTTPKEHIDLWSICLKAGQKQSSLRKAIESLWKKYHKIDRFNQDNRNKFQEFYRQIGE